MLFDYLPGYGPGEELPEGSERVAKAEHLKALGYECVMGATAGNGNGPYDAVTKEIAGDIRRPQRGLIGPWVYTVPERVLGDGQVRPAEIFSPNGAALWQLKEQR